MGTSPFFRFDASSGADVALLQQKINDLEKNK